MLSKLFNVKEFPRYVKEFPNYLRGTAQAKTVWGDIMTVPFPEFRSIVDQGKIVGHGEEAVYDYLDSHLNSNDTFFDVGANAGFYSLLAAHKGAHVHAFEPIPSTFALLRTNAEGKRIQIHQTAVTDSRGMVMMEKGAQPGLSHVSAKGSISVPGIALDEFPVTPTIMKIDVEGHEMSVFKGAQKLIQSRRPTIIAEVTNESREYLVSLGYKATLLGKTNYLFTRQ